MNWPAVINPWMLAGLAAAGLPVLIHFLTRARRKQVEFPPFQFLVEACAGQQAMHRLRTFILLAVRCLLAAVLAVIFARPFLRPEGGANAAEAGKRTVIIVDGSFSMRAALNGVTLFSRAQAEAADVLRGLENGSEAGVIIAGTTARALLPAVSKNIPALHEELLNAKPGFEKGTPREAFAVAAKMLAGVGTIYVFSDFQATTWERPGELPSGVICKLRSVAVGAAQNVAVTGVQLSPADPVLGESVEVNCSVLNSSSERRLEKVKLELAGVTQESEVSLEPFAVRNAIFRVTFPAAGFFEGKASIAGVDALPEDNSRPFVVQPRNALQLLVISDANETDRRSGAFFVAKALAPSTNSAPGVSIVRRHGQDVDRGALETADAFVVVAPAQLTGEAFEIISRRVYAGAQAIVFPDGPTAASLAVAAFSSPFQLGEAVTGAGAVRLAARKSFRDAEMEDWSGVRFFRHFKTTMLPGREGDALLLHADGAAALTLSKVGRGAVVFGNFPVTAEGGELVGSPMFPSLLQEMLQALRGAGERNEVFAGANLTVDAWPRGEAALKVTGPAGSLEAQTLSKGRTVRLDVGTTRAPGVYLARQGEEIVGGAVVNIDPAESDMRLAAMASIKVGAGSVSVVSSEQSLAAAAKGRELWPLFAAGAASLLLLETLLLVFWRKPAMRTTEAVA